MARELPAVIVLTFFLGLAFAMIGDLTTREALSSEASSSEEPPTDVVLDASRVSTYESICLDMRRDPPRDFARVNRAMRELRAVFVTAPPSDVPIVARQLEIEPEFETRRVLVQGLATIGGPEAMRVVEDHLWRVILRNDEKSGIEAIVTLREGLGQFSEIAVERLVGWSEWGPPGLRPYVLEAVSLVPVVHREGAVEALGDALTDDDAQIRKGAAIGLRGMRSARSLLSARLQVEPSIDVAGAIIQSLGAAADPAAVDSILEAARRHRDSVPLTWTAVDALEVCGGRDAVDALDWIHQNGPSSRVRARAFQAAERVRFAEDRGAGASGGD